uniref:Uncharacterized protein n=1 Tax=Rhizophora mucronata TaxID=61149 RepID=A0A2P2PHW5_RHIMU
MQPLVPCFGEMYWQKSLTGINIKTKT